MGTIRHDGKEVPAVLTVGAFRDFLTETGHDFLSDEKHSVYDLADLAWCGVKAAHEARGRSYEVSRKQFLAQMRMSELNALGAWFQAEQGEREDAGAEDKEEQGEKKSGE